ncbi:MAG: endonuclease YncB(thermonuclease family) [Myxococcota bacterium]|jgi:endonuclease YncB( thermonuclease family)
MENKTLTQLEYSNLLEDISKMIVQTKSKIENFARHQLIQTYWKVGKRIEFENLTQNANYFTLTISKLSEDLKIDKATLKRSVQFFKLYPSQHPEESSLTWSHYKYLLSINNEDQRLVFEEKAKEENWNVSKMQNEIKNFKAPESESSQIKRPLKANYLYRAKIMNVVDGDTLVLNVDLGFQVIKEQRIRLAQIDAPEMKTDEGQISFEYLKNLCANLEYLVIKTNKIDIFGRYVADVFYSKNSDVKQDKITVFEEGIYLNEELFFKGLAKVL